MTVRKQLAVAMAENFNLKNREEQVTGDILLNAADTLDYFMDRISSCGVSGATKQQVEQVLASVNCPTLALREVTSLANVTDLKRRGAGLNFVPRS